jgi:hypothetical protein
MASKQVRWSPSSGLARVCSSCSKKLALGAKNPRGAAQAIDKPNFYRFNIIAHQVAFVVACLLKIRMNRDDLQRLSKQEMKIS